MKQKFSSHEKVFSQLFCNYDVDDILKLQVKNLYSLYKH